VALQRNVYGTVEEVKESSLEELADYIMQEQARLATLSPERLLEGRLD